MQTNDKAKPIAIFFLKKMDANGYTMEQLKELMLSVRNNNITLEVVMELDKAAKGAASILAKLPGNTKKQKELFEEYQDCVVVNEVKKLEDYEVNIDQVINKCHNIIVIHNGNKELPKELQPYNTIPDNNHDGLDKKIQEINGKLLTNQSQYKDVLVLWKGQHMMNVPDTIKKCPCAVDDTRFTYKATWDQLEKEVQTPTQENTLILNSKGVKLSSETVKKHSKHNAIEVNKLDPGTISTIKEAFSNLNQTTTKFSGAEAQAANGNSTQLGT